MSENFQIEPSPLADIYKLIQKNREDPRFVLYVDWQNPKYPSIYNPPGLVHRPFVIYLERGKYPHIERDRRIREHENFITHHTLDQHGVEYQKLEPIKVEIRRP